MPSDTEAQNTEDRNQGDNTSEDTMMCSICHTESNDIDTIETHGEFYKLHCGHSFHLNCIKNWLDNYNYNDDDYKCALCRRDIKKDDIDIIIYMLSIEYMKELGFNIGEVIIQVVDGQKKIEVMGDKKMLEAGVIYRSCLLERYGQDFDLDILHPLLEIFHRDEKRENNTFFKSTYRGILERLTDEEIEGFYNDLDDELKGTLCKIISLYNNGIEHPVDGTTFLAQMYYSICLSDRFVRPWSINMLLELLVILYKDKGRYENSQFRHTCRVSLQGLSDDQIVEFYNQLSYGLKKKLCGIILADSSMGVQSNGKKFLIQMCYSNCLKGRYNRTWRVDTLIEVLEIFSRDRKEQDNRQFKKTYKGTVEELPDDKIVEFYNSLSEDLKDTFSSLVIPKGSIKGDTLFYTQIMSVRLHRLVNKKIMNIERIIFAEVTINEDTNRDLEYILKDNNIKEIIFKSVKFEISLKVPVENLESIKVAHISRYAAFHSSLMNLVGEAKNLKKITLDIPSYVLKKVIGYLADVGCKLETIDLQDFYHQSYNEIEQILEYNKDTVKELIFSPAIKKSGDYSFFTLLKTLPNLTRLELRDESIVSDEYPYLKQALEVMPKLEYLSLNVSLDNRQDTGEIIVEALNAAKNLKSLELGIKIHGDRITENVYSNTQYIVENVCNLKKLHLVIPIEFGEDEAKKLMKPIVQRELEILELTVDDFPPQRLYSSSYHQVYYGLKSVFKEVTRIKTIILNNYCEDDEVDIGTKLEIELKNMKSLSTLNIRWLYSYTEHHYIKRFLTELSESKTLQTLEIKNMTKTVFDDEICQILSRFVGLKKLVLSEMNVWSYEIIRDLVISSKLDDKIEVVYKF